MPERTSYTQGTPNWVDLPTSDQAAAKAFYAGLFGWTYDDQPVGEGQVYSMATLGGHQVAAISTQPAEMAAAGAPPMWNTYLAVDSVDEATAKVEAAGGKVAMAPFDIMDAGRMSFVMDPSGAPVALWQAGQHIGATLVNEPGTINWNELITDDPSVLKFYSDVLGLSTESMDMGEGQPYTVFKAGEAMVGGLTPPQMPGVPSHWHVYFGTDDADATAAKATELGHRPAVRHAGRPHRRAQRPAGRDLQRHQDGTPGLAMQMPKPSEDDKQYFRSILPGDPEVEVKPMFGNLGAFVHGNMFAGLFGSSVGVKLAEPDAAVLSAIDGAGPFGPAERPMGGYLSLPSGMTPDLAAQWVEKARSHVGSLPPKVKKPAKKKSAPAS
jgi:predicted enzyme related to lactoylglutathione lyase/TfoX/Sxy family transcriptional regulator of competence genes